MASRRSSTGRYYVTLAHAYRTGDLSFAYPLMRGTAPLLAAVLGIVFLREWPTPQVALGIAAHLRRHRQHRVRPPRGATRRPPRCFGARQRRDHRRLHAGRRRRRARVGQRGELRRVAHLSRGDPVPAVDPRAPRTRGGRLHRPAAGGAASSAARRASAPTAIVLWAMTRAPVAAVAALRETSVLFAALIGAIWLKEGFGLRRLAGAASVVARRRGAEALMRPRSTPSLPPEAP